MSFREMSSVIRRLCFVKLALKAQQNMAQLCRLFGISRKRGYKWKQRFEREGLAGLRDRSRRPQRSPRQISPKWLLRIRRIRRRHRSWGSRKLAAGLRREFPGEHVPAARTIGKWLKMMKLSRRPSRRYRRGPQLKPGSLTVARRSNQVWTVDFKGWFRTRNGQPVYPLTVRDLFSRYLLSVRLLKHSHWMVVKRIFLRLFRDNGYPKIIRVDNGPPFGSTGPLGLSRLSAWWTALGIRVEFIAPGHPEQNAGHEQMHRVFKAETTQPPSRNPRAQQRRIDRWVGIYNRVRPHQGLGQRRPAELYHPCRSTQLRKILLKYSSRWEVRRVRSNGQIKWRGRKRFIGEAFVGYPIGLKLADKGRYAVCFAGLVIGELWDSDAEGMRPAKYKRRF